MSKKNKQKRISMDTIIADPVFRMVMEIIRSSGSPVTYPEVMGMWAMDGYDENEKFRQSLLFVLGQDGVVGINTLSAAAAMEWNTNSTMEFFYTRLGQEPLHASEIQNCKDWLGDKFDACFALYFNLYVAENAPWADHVLQGGISFRMLAYGYQMGKSTPVSVQAPLAGPTIAISETVEFRQTENTTSFEAVTVSVAVETQADEQSAPIPVVAATTTSETQKEETMDNPSTAYTTAEAAIAAQAQAATKTPEPVAKPEQVRTPPPVFAHAGNGKGEGLVMKTAKVVGYTVAATLAVAAGVTAARYIASRFELSFD